MCLATNSFSISTWYLTSKLWGLEHGQQDLCRSLYPPLACAREFHYMYIGTKTVNMTCKCTENWGNNVKNQKNDFKVAVNFVKFGV